MRTVVDHQPVTVLIDDVGELLNVGGDLGLQRRRQHLPRTTADQLIQQRPRRCRVHLFSVRRTAYLQHRTCLPNPRPPAPV